MPIAILNPPAEATAAVTKLLQPGDAEILYPHRVYFMDLTDVATGRDLKSVQIGPWRHFVTRRGAMGESLDVVAVANAGGRHRVLHKTSGTAVAKSGLAIKRALADPDLQEGLYELRVLSIPALSINAIWLYSASGSILIPVGVTSPTLELGRKYPESEFLNAIRNRAQARLAFNNAPKEIRGSAAGR
jgi:hypothetical protein